MNRGLVVKAFAALVLVHLPLGCTNVSVRCPGKVPPRSMDVS